MDPDGGAMAGLLWQCLGLHLQHGHHRSIKSYDANMFAFAALIASHKSIRYSFWDYVSTNFHKCLNVWLPRCSWIKGMVGDLISMCLPGLWDNWIQMWHIGMFSLLTWVRKQHILGFFIFRVLVPSCKGIREEKIQKGDLLFDWLGDPHFSYHGSLRQDLVSTFFLVPIALPYSLSFHYYRCACCALEVKRCGTPKRRTIPAINHRS